MQKFCENTDAVILQRFYSTMHCTILGTTLIRLKCMEITLNQSPNIEKETNIKSNMYSVKSNVNEVVVLNNLISRKFPSNQKQIKLQHSVLQFFSSNQVGYV